MTDSCCHVSTDHDGIDRAFDTGREVLPITALLGDLLQDGSIVFFAICIQSSSEFFLDDPVDLEIGIATNG